MKGIVAFLKKYKSLFILLFLIVYCLFLILLFFLHYRESVLYKLKTELRDEVITMIGNEADLDSLKYHLETAFKTDSGFIERLRGEELKYYKNDVSLLTVLKDIQNDLYLSSDETQPVSIKILSRFIDEYEERNPFDSLEPYQKDLFENIRVKLGKDNYSIIESDINKLSSNILQKNNLVDEYLSDGKTSLFLSMLSILLGFFTQPFLKSLWNKIKQW